jgi:cell shape-determining protein MreC
MARKGDIDSKSVASRLPMDVYIQLLTQSSAKKQTISAYVCDVLSNHKNMEDKILHYKEQLKEYMQLLDKLKTLKGAKEIIKSDENFIVLPPFRE